MIIKNPLTMSVGNLGTSPVCKYSQSTGMNIKSPTAKKNRAKIEKNVKGL